MSHSVLTLSDSAADGDAGEAFLKKMGDTLRHLCNAAPQGVLT